MYFVLQSMKSSLLDFICCIFYLTIHVGDSLGTTVSVSRYTDVIQYDPLKTRTHSIT